MALALVVDNLEDVEEPLRPLYAEKEGKFHLIVDGLDSVTQNAVATATKKANKEAQELRHKMKPWETLGKSPEELQQMLAEWNDLQALKEKEQMTEAEKKGQWDELRKQLNEKHQKELDDVKKELLTKDDEMAKLKRRMEQHIIESTAHAAIAENKGIPQLLLPFVTKHLRMQDDFAISVVDDKGEPRINGKGDPLLPTEFVGEMRTNEVFGRAFEGTGSSGSGMRPGSGQGSQHPGTAKKSDFKDEKARSEFVDKYGLEAYQRLPA
jgi:hypothetical protein